LDSNFLDFQVPRFPGPQKSGLGQAWAGLGPGWVGLGPWPGGPLGWARGALGWAGCGWAPVTGIARQRSRRLVSIVLFLMLVYFIASWGVGTCWEMLLSRVASFCF